jgi:hypothetical protein
MALFEAPIRLTGRAALSVDTKKTPGRTVTGLSECRQKPIGPDQIDFQHPQHGKLVAFEPAPPGTSILRPSILRRSVCS